MQKTQKVEISNKEVKISSFWNYGVLIILLSTLSSYFSVYYQYYLIDLVEIKVYITIGLLILNVLIFTGISYLIHIYNKIKLKKLKEKDIISYKNEIKNNHLNYNIENVLIVFAISSFLGLLFIATSAISGYNIIFKGTELHGNDIIINNCIDIRIGDNKKIKVDNTVYTGNICFKGTYKKNVSYKNTLLNFVKQDMLSAIPPEYVNPFSKFADNGYKIDLIRYIEKNKDKVVNNELILRDDGQGTLKINTKELYSLDKSAF